MMFDAMHKAQKQDFDWSDCSVADAGNRAFLKGDRTYITAQQDKQFSAVFLPLFFAVALYTALQRAPLWISLPAHF